GEGLRKMPPARGLPWYRPGAGHRSDIDFPMPSPSPRTRAPDWADSLPRARGDVDGIAPNVVGELARADDPCHHGAGMHAHPDRKWGRQPRPQSAGSSNHVEGEFCRHPGVIGARRWHAADRHVVVADRLDLFDPGVFGELVEFAEQLIKAGDDFKGFH